MNKNIFTLGIFIISLFGCSKENDEVNGKEGDKSCEKGSNVQTLIHNGEEREYILYIPSSYNETDKIPLLFNFHGYGGRVNEYITYADMRPLADSKQFILVYPQGSCSDGSPHWNPSLPHPDNKSTVDDFGFIEALIDQISSQYMIDSERVYACGYSNGGMMSYGLASHKSNLIAAIGSVSGAMLDTDVMPSHPMPVITIHGTSDNVLPYNGNSSFNSIETTLNFWVGFNKTNTTPVSNSENDDGTTIEHYQYSGGDNGVSVEHYKIIDGGHVWFDINYRGSNTNLLIWDFLSKYDINGLR